MTSVFARYEKDEYSLEPFVVYFQARGSNGHPVRHNLDGEDIHLICDKVIDQFTQSMSEEDKKNDLFTGVFSLVVKEGEVVDGQLSHHKLILKQEEMNIEKMSNGYIDSFVLENASFKDTVARFKGINIHCEFEIKEDNIYIDDIQARNGSGSEIWLSTETTEAIRHLLRYQLRHANLEPLEAIGEINLAFRKGKAKSIAIEGYQKKYDRFESDSVLEKSTRDAINEVLRQGSSPSLS